MAKEAPAAGSAEATATDVETTSWLWRQRMLIAGCLFVVAGNAVAYADAGYPLLSTLFVAVLAVSFLIPLLVALPFTRWPSAGVIVFTLGACHFLDVAFLDDNLVSSIVLALLPLAIIAVVWRGHGDILLRSVSTMIGFAALSILGQQLVAPASLTPRAFSFAGEGGNNSAPYLHIILDEMGALSSMPDKPEFAALQQRMRADYAKRGFLVFDDTEVVAGATELSLGHVFSRDGEASHREGQGGQFAFELDENRLLGDLRTKGYRVNVLQNSFLRLCETEDETCRTYARSGDGKALEAAVEGIADGIAYTLLDLHLILMSSETVRGSAYYARLARVVEVLGLSVPRSRFYVSRPPQVVGLMRETAAALPALDSGEAFVGHFLLPHFPYVLDSDCTLEDPDERAGPNWLTKPGEAPFVLERAEASYWKQAACTHDTLMTMIDAVIDGPAGKDAVIVVHGDHGSRLLRKVEDPEGTDAGASAQERRLALNAHFAVRGMSDRLSDLASRPTLRDRIGIVLDSLPGPSPVDAALTGATP